MDTFEYLLEALIKTIPKVARKLWSQDPKTSLGLLQDLLAQVSDLDKDLLAGLEQRPTGLGLASDETTTEDVPTAKKLSGNSEKVLISQVNNTVNAPCEGDRKAVPSSLAATAPPSGASEGSNSSSSKSTAGPDQGPSVAATKRGLKHTQVSISHNDSSKLGRPNMAQPPSQCIIPDPKITEKPPEFQGKSRNGVNVVATPDASSAEESCGEEETKRQLTSGSTIDGVQSPQNAFRHTIALFKGTAIDGDAMELAREMVQVVLKYSMGDDGTSNEADSSILEAVKDGLAADPLIPKPSGGVLMEWSTTQWENHFQLTEARHGRSTLRRMLSYIACSIWFEEKRRKSMVERAGQNSENGSLSKQTASLVLNELFPKLHGSDDKSRNKARTQFHQNTSRGGRLRSMTAVGGLGILMSPNIWKFLKASKADIEERVVAPLEKDPMCRKLLEVLTPQVDHIIYSGRSSMDDLWSSLAEGLGPEEMTQLRSEFADEKDVLPDGQLTSAIDQSIHYFKDLIGTSTTSNDKVTRSGKRHAESSEDDKDITIRKTGFPLRSLKRLAEGWLDNWILSTCLELTDKAQWVLCGQSIPLQNESRPILTPFAGWRKKIDTHRKRRDENGQGPGVYLCPVNHNNTHFTLLVIDDRKKKIFHYDPMLPRSMRQASSRKDSFRRVVEDEFGPLGFGYRNASNPQQNDASSCGLFVWRAATRVMNDQDVGEWDDRVDPARIRMAMVEVISRHQDQASYREPGSKRRKIADSA